jgi:hypothetical protein
MKCREVGRSIKPVWVAVFSMLGPAVAAQQTCDTHNYPLSSPSSRFEDHGDGTVTDTLSKLMWMRCSAGQTWSGAACNGTVAGFSWQAANEAAKRVNQAGDFFYKDWRVPQIRELATLTERQCANPRINLALFPNTPAAFYWTASSRQAQGTDPAAFALSFGADGVRYEDKEDVNLVRLVRSAE